MGRPLCYVVIIDQTRIFENIGAFKFVLPCISRVMVRSGCEGNGDGHYVIIIILYLENADSYNMYKTQ